MVFCNVLAEDICTAQYKQQKNLFFWPINMLVFCADTANITYEKLIAILITY